MIAVPSIVMLLLISALSAVASVILSRSWMRWTAAGLAAMEFAMALGLIVLVARS